MTPRTSFTFKLSASQQSTLVSILKQGNYRPVRVEHTIIAATTPGCNISLYKSGKCLIQGKEASDFVMFILEPNVLGAAQLGYEDILNPETNQPRMGIDESGKGDFFGPLVVAGAYVDEELAKQMRKMDVKDSKLITSDAKAMGLGADLRRLLGNRFSVVKIGPQTYNKLYSRMRNVNTMLGWAHARAIENLLETVPSCPMAISDQFGSKQQVERALMKNGREIELVQRHKAESDTAVAAASIIARDIFLRSLKQMEEKYGMKIPKGASQAVRDTAKALAQKNGPEVLLEAAKCHFQTTDKVLAEMKTDRSALGPEGKAVSRPMGNRFAKKRAPKSEATE